MTYKLNESAPSWLMDGQEVVGLPEPGGEGPWSIRRGRFVPSRNPHFFWTYTWEAETCATAEHYITAVRILPEWLEEKPALLTAADYRARVQVGDTLRFAGGDVEVCDTNQYCCYSSEIGWYWSRIALAQPEIIKPAAPDPDPEPCECVVRSENEYPAAMVVDLPEGYREGDTVEVRLVRRAK